MYLENRDLSLNTVSTEENAYVLTQEVENTVTNSKNTQRDNIII